MMSQFSFSKHVLMYFQLKQNLGRENSFSIANKLNLQLANQLQVVLEETFSFYRLDKNPVQDE